MVSKKKVNKMNTNEVIINQKDHPDIYEWLSQYVYYYKELQRYFTLTSEGKINADCEVDIIRKDITQFKYHFNVVRSHFNCDNCYDLTSLIGTPEKVDDYFSFDDCKNLTSLIGFPKYVGGDIDFCSNNFSNNPSYKEQYKIYIAMWLELFESVSNKEHKEYITNYKDKKHMNHHPIIPTEIMKEYGF